MQHNNTDKYTLMANAVRMLAADAVEKAQSGHPGMPLGTADIATVLFSQFLKFDPTDPHWPDRDRFILSAGHGSMLLYACLHLLGYQDMTIQQIKKFRQINSLTPGHPEYNHTPGVETTTGPLGQGLANAVGMAIAEKIMAARFGNTIVNHYTYAIVSDGDLMEGITQEAITLAGHLKLNKLIFLFDDNGISIDGCTTLADSTDQISRFAAANWHTEQIDGHDHKQIATAIQNAQNSEKPCLILCKTTIGKGAPNKQNSHTAHGAPLGHDEIRLLRKNLGWTYKPFEIPSEIYDMWRVVGLRGAKLRKIWNQNLNQLNPKDKAEFERRITKKLPENLETKMKEHINDIIKQKPNIATRKASQNTLNVINTTIPDTIGGSADLSESNNTKTETINTITHDNFNGRYIHYGIREHAMTAIMSGMSLHGGIIPYGGTFLIFSDYARPAIRLAAIMKQRTIYVLTHDSIGLGEDGPTHQPIEHLASLRAIPNLNVFRPADAVETAECWHLAITDTQTPSVIALSRQKLPHIRNQEEKTNLSENGAYQIFTPQNDPQTVIFASGSEVHIAIQAAQKLQNEQIYARVISVPAMQHFEKQSPSYQKQILGDEKCRIAVEAGIKMGWEKWIGQNGTFIGMENFGASAPAETLFKHFKITEQNIINTVKKNITR